MKTRAVLDTATMKWEPSPSGTVWRKRLHLVGEAEAGQVTSVVRYQPNSSFPIHDHPGGEEILVLDGVFSDEHGDWPEGTYLLNPEGFRHAPFSKEGCLLLVKLRQYGGEGRHHVAIDTRHATWKHEHKDGIARLTMYDRPGFPEKMILERWPPGASLGRRSFPGGAEYFVLEGGFEDEMGEYGLYSWLRLPAGAGHFPKSEHGCLCYMKIGGVSELQSA